MKVFGWFLVFGCALALGRDVTEELNITKGPYYVPVTNSSYNVLGSDFHDEGEALVFLTKNSIHFEFPRLGLTSLKFKQDETDPNYYLGKGKEENALVRLGFEKGKLMWFFSKGDSWEVKIASDAEDKHVEATSFAKMTDAQLIHLAELLTEMTDFGGIESPTIKRGAKIEITANAVQMGYDDPEVVGKAVFVFSETGTKRWIKVAASVEDLPQEE